MASVYDLARELGEGIKTTPQWEMVEKAKSAFDSSPETGILVADYNAMQQQYQMKAQQGTLTPEEQEELGGKLQTVGEQIRNNKIATELFTAENQLNDLMQSLFNMAYATASGKVIEDSCASGCGGCGGGCH